MALIGAQFGRLVAFTEHGCVGGVHNCFIKLYTQNFAVVPGVFLALLAFHGADGVGQFEVRQFEQVAGFHGWQSTYHAAIGRLRQEFMRWLWENQSVPKRHIKNGKRKAWVRSFNAQISCLSQETTVVV